MKKFSTFIKKLAAVVLTAGVIATGLTACQSSNNTAESNGSSDGVKVVRIGSSGTDGTATDAARIAQELGYFEEELGKVG